MLKSPGNSVSGVVGNTQQVLTRQLTPNALNQSIAKALAGDGFSDTFLKILSNEACSLPILVRFSVVTPGLFEEHFARQPLSSKWLDVS